ncbi:MAG: cysteine desulfurase family protein [Tissierellia bacterium]|nr:cysteine desulfurase family protein [Tissierellia bacterium]
MIYLDNAATTQPLPEVLEAYKRMQLELWANPSSLHEFGEDVFFELKEVRDSIKNLLHGREGDIIFTSGATEGINTFLRSVLRREGHVITSAYEHAAVHQVLKAYEAEGGRVTYLQPEHGIITKEAVLEAIQEDTLLVALMHVNNEIGVKNPIADICRAVKARRSDILFFSDGVQAGGKIPVDLQSLAVDGYALSAHKFHGLKGTGLLYVRNLHLHPLILGGGQENGLRSGTQNVGGIVAMEEALRHCIKDMDQKLAHVESLRNICLEELKELKGMKVNQFPESIPHILSLSFTDLKGEVLVHMLDQKKIYVNTKSACSSTGHKASRTLQAIGLSDREAMGTIRLSFDSTQSEEDIRRAAREIRATVEELQQRMGGFRGV